MCDRKLGIRFYRLDSLVPNTFMCMMMFSIMMTKTCHHYAAPQCISCLGKAHSPSLEEGCKFIGPSGKVFTLPGNPAIFSFQTHYGIHMEFPWNDAFHMVSMDWSMWIPWNFQ
ncbi:uncharacterized protein LACBIDRAFT_322467 [Laccaria bicolor S238N-H82]|uniref:Predicted protein n=1 Tax=Laccaria bicolor (strain S238N-H82 / ATCC MYA-4686) TaxID=486041 RepID=B0CWE3_LACBS|nr:uncharacterized protein LACBIDRAFT_322467 [Laccaria bicolor S238N-H82]EDR13053.1 predicted protein [Laccaria bicolor S238N-H82]|eukprot:XP_001875551.1 predicted protein [Laccaria bicolor S238N-H82]